MLLPGNYPRLFQGLFVVLHRPHQNVPNSARKRFIVIDILVKITQNQGLYSSIILGNVDDLL